MKEKKQEKWARNLKEHGVTLVNSDNATLHCDNCGQEWSPNLQEGGLLPRGYWKCPNGCNATKEG